jgi:hypothetical protein
MYAGLMAWQAGVEAIRMTVIREAWETAVWDMEVWPARWFFSLGCAGMSLVFLAQAWRRAAALIGREQPRLEGADERRGFEDRPLI